MLIDDYKEAILHELETARDSDEVEQIINHSVEQFPEVDLDRFLVIIYLHLLQNRLEKLSEKNFESVEWRNIRHGLLYLKKMNEDRSKTE